MARILASIPHPEAVRPLLRRPFFGRKWNWMKRRDHWLASDGSTVVCLMISGATAGVIARMRSRFDDLRLRTPGLRPSAEILGELLALIEREQGSIERARAPGMRSR